MDKEHQDKIKEMEKGVKLIRENSTTIGETAKVLTTELSKSDLWYWISVLDFVKGYLKEIDTEIQKEKENILKKVIKE